MVFGPFYRLRQRRQPAGNQAEHLARLGVERWRTLGGVEDSEPPGRASANVDEPAAAAQLVGDDLDGSGDGLLLRRDGRNDACVFRVH